MHLQENQSASASFPKTPSSTGSKRLRDAGPDDEVEIALLVRRKQGCSRLPAGMQASAGSVLHRQYLSRAAFERSHGVSEADLDAIERFAGKHGLSVMEFNTTRRVMVLKGSVNQILRLFFGDLNGDRRATASKYAWLHTLQAPAEIAGAVESVLVFQPDAMTLFPGFENTCEGIAESFALRAGYLA